MRSSAKLLAATCAALCAWLSLVAAATPVQAHAASTIAYTPCADSNDFACGHLTVPLDPSGATPGTITLALRRHRATIGEAHSAIIALAGGPGQPALPLSELFSEVLGQAAATRDLIVFDQRGIGQSGALSCHALERPNLFHSNGALVETCASQLGPTRTFYTTTDTVADIEAIRVAGGYEKLVLYGTSYGTKVAEEYAQQYPSHVEALVLDSVVPPNGPDPLNRTTFAAVPRVLTQMCADHVCAHITSNPAGDLRRVVAQMAHGPLRGRVIDGSGRAHTVPVFAAELYELLLAGDFSPLLRADFVTAVGAAARHDSAPLARLVDEAGAESEDEGEDFDTPLFFATSCEDEAFPWNRAATPSARLAEAQRAAAALPASTFAPFTAAEAIELGDAQTCAYWRYTTPSPPPNTGPLPNVPTLILSGAGDLRTPTANAREVAAQIPDAHLLLVPYSGHSVLTDEPTNCAKEALQAFFATANILPCKAAPPPPALLPPPLPPLQLGHVSPAGHPGGLPGRTLHAVALTLGALERELAIQLAAKLTSLESLLSLPTISSGGLRSGWAREDGDAISLHRYSYVPGLAISGTLNSGAGELRVSGASAADGSLRISAHGALTGTLGGQPARLLQAPGATAAIVGEDAAASPDSPSRRAAGAALGRLLAELFGGRRA